MYTYYEGTVHRAGALRLCPHGVECPTETQKPKREGQNPPHIAYKTVENALRDSGAKIGEDIGLCVANRYEVTRFI